MAIPLKTVLTVSTQGFTTGIKASTKALGVFAGVAKSAAIAVTALAGTLAAVILTQTRFIDTLGKTSSKLGVGVEFLQKFRFAATQTGVSTETADMALQRFTRRLGEAQKGTGELLPALKELGFTQQDIRDLSPEQALFALADAISATESPTNRLALAFKAFDSEGAALINTIGGGREELLKFFNIADDLGFVLSADAVQGVEDFNDSLDQLFLIITGVIRQVVTALAPTLLVLTEQLKDLFKELQDEDGGFETLANTIKDTLLGAFDSFLGALETVLNFLADLANAIVQLGRAVPGVDLFPLDPDDAAKYERLRDAITGLTEIQASLRGGFVGRVPSTGFQDAIDDLRALGFEVTVLQDAFDELSFADFASRLLPGGMTDEMAFFTEALQNAVALGLEVSDEELKEFLPFGNLDFSDLRQTLRDQIGQGFVQGVKKGTEDPETEEDILSLFDRILARVQEITGVVAATLKQKFEAAGIGDFTKTLEDGLVRAATMFEDALAQAFVNGKADFSDLADFIKVTLAKAFIQKTITGPLLALVGLASGGPAMRGRPYIVGEEGPELFVPDQSGVVVPNSRSGAGNFAMANGTTVINNNINAVDTQSFQQALARDPEFIYSLTRVGARRTPA